MSIMTAPPMHLPRLSLHPQSPSDVQPTILQPSPANRSAKRKRDDDSLQETSTIKGHDIFRNQRQTLLVPYPLPLIPSPRLKFVNNTTPLSNGTSPNAPYNLKNDPSQTVSHVFASSVSSSEKQSVQDGSKMGSKMEDKRSLRSHDGGSRSKSELAQYFANYEELLSLETKEQGELPPF